VVEFYTCHNFKELEVFSLTCNCLFKLMMTWSYLGATVWKSWSKD